MMRWPWLFLDDGVPGSEDAVGVCEEEGCYNP